MSHFLPSRAAEVSQTDTLSGELSIRYNNSPGQLPAREVYTRENRFIEETYSRDLNLAPFLKRRNLDLDYLPKTSSDTFGITSRT